MIEFTRWSEWSKWDLHIHTPLSVIQWYWWDTEEVWEKFIIDLESLPKEYKVIWINDYNLIDWYEKVLEYQKKWRLKNIDLILPVLEFRLKEFWWTEELKSVNFHVIFSNEISIEDIKKNFINKLEVEINDDIKSTITSINCLVEYWKKLKDKDIVKNEFSDLITWFNQARFDRKQILKILKEYFNWKYLTAIGKNEWESLRWTWTIVDKKKIINSADFVFTASEKVEDTIKWKEKLREQGVNNNLLHFSDSHYFSNDTQNSNKIWHSFTWIKANPTFNWLVQVLNEQEERVYLWDKPKVLRHIFENKDKYINELRITSIPTYNGEKWIWFKWVEIPLNTWLVTIIWNKWSWKSAIADILWFLWNAQNNDKFSFLHAKKFKSRNLAKNFNWELLWNSWNISKANLNDEIDVFSDETVRYLPQSYFESIANEIYNHSGNTKSKLTITLENVVYKYLDDSDKLWQWSFDALLKYKMESINANIDSIKIELSELNAKIIDLENKNHPDYIKILNNKLDWKNEEIDLLNKSLKELTTEYTKSINSENETKEDWWINKKLESLNKKLLVDEKLIQDQEEKLLNIKKDIVDLENLIEKYNRFKENIENNIKEDKDIFEKFWINNNEVYKNSIDTSVISKICSNKNEEQKSIEYLLLSTKDIESLDITGKDELLKNSLLVAKENTIKSIWIIEKQLSTEEKKKHEYEVERKRLNDEISLLIWNKDKHNTKIYFEEEIKYISNLLFDELNWLKTDRTKIVNNIFNEKKSIVSLYKEFKEPIDNKLSNEQISLNEYTVEVDVGIRSDKNLWEKFLDYINQSKSWTFYWWEFWSKAMNDILQYKDYNNIDDILYIINETINSLEIDKRENGNWESKNISDQVSNLKAFYDYLYWLDYINPEYQLKMMWKQIYELSPGERGTLLLIFYLLIDKENIPLIIDQPEDNLDNQSVYKMLSKFIKDAKKRRQIIIVTHNPNLAIWWDAEQIIYVHLDKKDNKNEFSFYSWSIENPKINKEIQNILEWTRPAFMKRDNTYFN